MSTPSDDELLARLRAADPAADLPPADGTEVDRLLRRVVDADLRETGTRRRNPLTWLVAAAAAVVIAGGLAWWIGANRTEPGVVAGPGAGSTASMPNATELTVAPASGGRCMMPTPEMLAAKPVAFEGKVLGIADGVATLRPTTVYAGEVGDEVTVTGAVAPGAGGIEGDPAFEAGQDYLVAADGGRVAGCGLSGPVTAELEALYTRAFPR